MAEAGVLYTGWRPGPQQRGTLDIIWGAFITLTLCVWTAVHPNIQLRPGTRRGLAIRLLMMVVAVLFPEILISAAWHQRTMARRLIQSISKTKQPADEPRSLQQSPVASNEEDANDNNDWTSTQAFFAVMGGFAVHHAYYVRGKKQEIRSIFTVDGIDLMKRCGLVPTVTKADIDERSNADIIAKLIVIIQVLWFAIQIIARLASNLTVTTLEVHTIVHVGCAITMYALWWDKPYALRRSLILEDGKSKAIGSLYLFNQILQGQHEKAVQKHDTLRREYWEKRAIVANQSVNRSTNLIDHDPPPDAPQMLTIAQALATNISSDGASGSYEMTSDNDEEAMLRSVAKDAHTGLQLLLDQEASILYALEQPTFRSLRQTSENFTLRQVWGSWTVDTGHEMSKAKAMHFIFNLCYGGGHLAAWNSSALTIEIERILWQVSGIVVAALFAYGSLWVLFWTGVRSKSRWTAAIRRGDFNMIVAPFFFAMILAYIIARCYFFVESLVNLRSLPESAYQTVQWTNFLPHSG
ncbi:hypothetical protein H2198_001288 [Neophaeococcomyces mojaviensis]|uniref:Uncharacterized protein n=1 Tax=Neophaeococcomyces mojaviensis TaxID=3383035 RepID=A0ACC3AHH9_9EURO|nr:hypothetical protein H2198_001288 [Knufia sp. JES_112]